MHVVGHRKDIAGKTSNTVRACIQNLALGAFAQILHFGKGTQQLVLVLRGFARRLGHRIGCSGGCRFDSLVSHGFALAGCRVRHRSQSILSISGSLGYQGSEGKNQAFMASASGLRPAPCNRPWE
jgi:hypothetical protein